MWPQKYTFKKKDCGRGNFMILCRSFSSPDINFNEFCNGCETELIAMFIISWDWRFEVREFSEIYGVGSFHFEI